MTAMTGPRVLGAGTAAAVLSVQVGSESPGTRFAMAALAVREVDAMRRGDLREAERDFVLVRERSRAPEENASMDLLVADVLLRQGCADAAPQRLREARRLLPRYEPPSEREKIARALAQLESRARGKR
jgi:hypothetical protein